MTNARQILDFFRFTPLRHWPGLFAYFVGATLYRLLHISLFQEKILRFHDISVVADVQGMSGLAFLYEIMVKDVYCFPELRNDASLRVIFDAGANCGFYAITQCARNHHLRALSFEPQPNTFSRLQKNIRANGLEERIRPMAVAVGSVPGACVLQVSKTSSMGIVSTSKTQSLDSPTTIEVPMVSLDAVAKAENAWPDLIKIDVEGFEAEVLKGAPACLKHARYAVLECHSEELTRECEEILGRNGFQIARKGSLLFGRKGRVSNAAQANR